MKKFLFFLTSLIFTMNLFGQVKLNVWDKNPNVAKTINNIKPNNLPKSFESTTPDGEKTIYDRWDVPRITVETSKGKSYTTKPVAYKSRNGFGVLTYSKSGWQGLHSGRTGKFYSMTPSSVKEDTTSLKSVEEYCGGPIGQSDSQINDQKKDTKKTPSIGRLTNSDFYNPLVPINKTCSVYAEIAFDLHTALGGNLATTEDWTTRLFLGVSQIYLNEGITLYLNKIYVWETIDPYGYTTQTGSTQDQVRSNVLSIFTGKILNNLPTNPNSNFKHLLTNASYGGVAYYGPLTPSDGYTAASDIFGEISRVGLSSMGNKLEIASTPTDLSVYNERRWCLLVVSHELGHNFGSRHTQWCGWRNDAGTLIGRLDSCTFGESSNPLGPNCASTSYPSSKPTIMSYCQFHPQAPNFSQFLSNGFGKYPRFSIRTGLANASDIPYTNASIPTLTTTPIVTYTATTATSGGNITSDGGANVTSRGVCWSTSPNPTISGSRTLDGSFIGSFTSNITGLLGGTTYYVRAYATNQAGTGYGNEVSFTTSVPLIPTLSSTTAVTSISNNSAVSGGNVSSNGGGNVTARGVCWSTSANPTVSNSKTTDGTGTGSFTSNLTGLSAGTTYYVRSYATNSAGSGYGPQVTFSTFSSTSILINTTALTGLAPKNVTTGGTITSDGGSAVTSRGVCWSTTSPPTISNSKVNTGTGTGTYTSTVSGLSPSTTYYLRSFATNSSGTSYGNEIPFTTPSAPTLTNGTPSYVSQTSIKINYTISFPNQSFSAHAQGASTTNPPDAYNLNSLSYTFNSVSGTYQSLLGRKSTSPGLQPSTTYFIRPFATDIYDNYYYGPITQATTLAPSLPVCTTYVATEVSTPTTNASTAKLSGKVTSIGGAITERGFCYSTTQNPTTSNSKVTGGFCSSDDECLLSFTNTGTNFTPGTTYYVRSYAINSTGVGYGNQISFTTPIYVYQGPPIVVIDSIRNISTVGAKLYGRVTNNGGSNCVLGSSCRGVVISAVTNSPLSNCGLDANFDPLCWSFVETPNVQSITGAFEVDFQPGNQLMKANTTYYVRAYATNFFGNNQNNYGYSPTSSFKTLATGTTPLLYTNTTLSITTTSATSGGYITSQGGATVTQRGVVWSTSPNPTTSLATKTSNGTGTGTYTSNMTGLTPNTLYYVRAYAVNSFGTSYGSQQQFTTNASVGLATLTTTSVTNLSTTSVTSGGNITNSGGTNVTTRGVCYSTSTNPTITNGTVVSSGSGTGSFTTNITGLIQGTTYYLRAFATNTSGTSYGNQVQFTTLTLPSITTTSASNVTSTTVFTGGNVTSDGGSTITERGVCYETTQNPTTGNFKLVSTGTTGTFTSNITDLTPGTTYYVRAYAINSVGTQYGTQISFTTTAAQTEPTVTTTNPTSITTNTVSSGGTVSSDGNSTVSSRGVVWSTSSSPTTNLTTKTVDGSGTGSFTSSVVGLLPGVLYYIRSYATNSIGTAYGSELAFTTLTTTPTLSATITASSITQTSSISGGNVTSDGGLTITERGVCWSTSSNPTVSLSTKTIDGSGVGSFVSDLTGLSASTTYYVRAYATNSNGTSYGTQISFTTLSSTTVPTVTTTTASSITLTSAVSGGNVTSDGGSVVTSRGMVWSTTSNPTISLSTKTQDGTGPGIFTSSITGLSSATTYYYRAYATNANGTSYGSQLTFTTGANLPTLTTTNISSITLTSAISGGNITSDGGSSVTVRGVVWSTSTNPTISLTTKTSNGTGTGAFTSSITGLNQNTLYYVRAYATNSAGTSYGNQVTFTTSNTSLATLTTSSPTSVDFTSAVSGGNITSDGNATVTSRGVCWSTSQNPTLSNSFTVDGSGTGSFTSTLTDLSPGLTYYVKAYATNSVGTSYGNETLFTTVPGQSPEVSTDVVNNVSSTNAEIVYSIVSLGGGTLTEKGIAYSTSPNPTTSNFKVFELCALESPCEVGQYTQTFFTSLNPNVTYYVRAFATSEFGTSYGQELSFTTPIDFPVLSTTTISNITSTTASSGGAITSTGGGSISAKGVCWSTSPSPTLSNSFTNDGTGQNSFTSSITGLLPGVLYYVRSYATNQTGTNYGNQLTFTTTSTSTPTLTTNSVTSITTTSAVSGGNITSDGGSSVTARGVVWSTSENPTVSNNRTIDGSGIGSYTSSMTGLVPGTTYYVRSYATSSSGTSYGQQNIFTTSGSVPTISTTSITNIGTSSASSGGNVTSSGGSTVTSRGVIWSTSPSPTVSLSTKTVNGSGIGSFTSSITGLSPSTTYYLRSYATNSTGTGYGNEVSFTTSLSGGGSCAISGLTVTRVNNAWNFAFNINPNCTSYTVNVCRYLNTNPAVPPTANQTPVACAVRNNMTSYVPTSSEISAGVITRVMNPPPAYTGVWYSVDVTCNGTCTGNKTTRSSYFYNPIP